MSRAGPLGVLALLLVAACSSSAVVDAPRGAPGSTAAEASGPLSAAPPPPRAAAPAGPCGFDARDWCPSPRGDRCGAHKDAASCKADAGCVGVHYRGSSVVRCAYDARGFAANCPTVGCVSR